MRGAILYAPGDVRCEERRDPMIMELTDAIVRTVATCVSAPVRNYLPDLVDRVWSRRIEPGKVFDLTLPLEQVAETYRAMDEPRAIKVLLQP